MLKTNCQHYNSHHRVRRGATLTEVVMALMITGVVLVGALSLVGASLKTRRSLATQNDGARLAEQLLAEIMAMPYMDPESPGSGNGTDAGEGNGNRKKWDDVDDYRSWSRSPPRTKDHAQMTEYAGWTRSCSVTWAERMSGNIWLFYDTGLKRIKVTVTSPDGKVTERYGLRSEWGSLQQPPAQDTTVVTMISGKLEIGDSGVTSHAATNTFNHVADPNAN